MKLLLVNLMYLHLFSGIYKSVSIRVLNELFSAKNHSMSLNELKEKYTINDLVYKRLDTMVINKWLELKNNKYICKNKAIFIVKINLFFIKLFKLSDTA